MKYVDVILPLPLEGLFTYGVPPHLLEQVQRGVRVVVPLGKSKTYTALAVELHDELPEHLGAREEEAEASDGRGKARKKVEVKDIRAVLDERPVVLEAQLRLWQWIADYYMSPIGEVMKAALPSGLKQEDGWRPRTETYVALPENCRNEQTLHAMLSVLKRSKKQQETLLCYLSLSHWDMAWGDAPEAVAEVTREELMNEAHCTSAIVKALQDRGFLMTYEKEVGRVANGGQPHPERIKPLSEVQQDAYNRLLLQMMSKRVVLLHGVTSSGKTELYIHLIQKTIDEGKQVLYLLPEIALTVQMMERLQRVFGNRLAIYHSKYSDAERVEIWQKQLSKNPYDVVLGARSACLLPFQRLGLVIVDEEHETSFKQQDPAPRYHARSVATVMTAPSYLSPLELVRLPKQELGEVGGMEGASVLLGTATPSMESYYNAQTGKYGLVMLMERYQGIELPEIRVVDVRDLRRRKMMRGPFSPALLQAMRQALDDGDQVILFQNRRGFAPTMECKACGWVPRCKNCDVPLTLHKNMNVLTCHYCGAVYPVPTECPNCESTELRGRGFGTEKIEDHVRELFPDVKVARMDLDTTHTRAAYERMISDFSAGRTQVLIGTQMVTKGLDFDRVRVVGILDADTMLNYPDFRAYEHAFMMMAQVSGRAGRKGKRGLVLLQTKNASLPVITQVVSNDFRSFYSDLLEERRQFCYPPFYRIVNVFLKHRHEDTVNTAGYEMSSRLREVFGSRVLGPDKPSVARVKQLCIRKIVLKLENGIDQKKVREYLRMVQSQLLKDSRYGALQVYYDVDPL